MDERCGLVGAPPCVAALDLADTSIPAAVAEEEEAAAAEVPRRREWLGPCAWLRLEKEAPDFSLPQARLCCLVDCAVENGPCACC